MEFEQEEQKTIGKDILFANEPARRAFKLFRKVHVREEDDATVNTLIRFDAVITSIVDSFNQNIEDIERKITSNENKDDNEPVSYTHLTLPTTSRV